MNIHYLEEAIKVVPDPQVLINMVSRRVRQLTASSRPMVEVEPRMGYADIALAEIAQGKVGIAERTEATDFSTR
jgi:DNA-directed RNA polymerase subunit omega